MGSLIYLVFSHQIDEEELSRVGRLHHDLPSDRVVLYISLSGSRVVNHNPVLLNTTLLLDVLHRCVNLCAKSR